MYIKKSRWKFPFNPYTYKINKEGLKIFDRNITLTTSFVGKTLNCHKGKVCGKLLVMKKHLNHKLGEFFITKILGERVFYRKKQKALLKKKKRK